ncbi:AMP-binding protein [Streptomyces alkaliphilus]|uniref:AMP-binding protein n=1 Tax=Streptomyces alkaliphilus TaxID=1472722 RepID=UPI00117FA2A5|nr:AMP-binding protein [Streptomyces alkaliphilus]MQS05656.1 AMP-binding protein [Streptomyces alkaliphilus]
MSTVTPGSAVPPEWHHTDAPYDRSATMVDLVERSVRRRPTAPAVETADGTSISYRELWDRASALADRLGDAGVRRGSQVGVADRHTEWTVIGELAILMLGAAFVPLDARWPAARLAGIFGQLTRLHAVVAGFPMVGTVESALWMVQRPDTPVVVVGPGTADDLVDLRGTPELWDEIASAADLEEAAGFRRDDVPPEDIRGYVDHVESLVQRTAPGGSVFEVGCGVGLIGRRLVAAGHDYVGADPSPASLARLRDVTAGRAGTVTGFAHTVDVPAGTDVVLLASVTQFFPDLHYAALALRHLMGRLPVGGALVIADVLDAEQQVTGGQLPFPRDWFEAVFKGRDPGFTAEVEIVERDPADWNSVLGHRFDVLVRKTAECRPAPRDAGPPGEGSARTVERPSSQDPAYLIFTSGSTGVPKGVVVEHTNVVNLIEWFNAHYRVAEHDRLLWVTSSAFDLSIYDIFGILAAGAVICVPGPDSVGDAERLRHDLHSLSITLWDSAPAAFEEVLAARGPVLASMRKIFLSGDWVPVSLPGRLPDAFPNATLSVLGGATEATVWSNYFDVDTVDPGWPSIPYGCPIPNTRYYVLGEDGRQVPVGEPGELYIAGTAVARGYLGSAASERFGTDPFTGDGQRLYATGDRAMWLPEGVLRFLGRTDDQVKIRGYRVDLGDVRSALLAVSGVDDAVVAVSREDSGDRLIGAVAGDPRRPPITAAMLRREMASRLPTYMIPGDFVIAASLPVGATGKVDRGEIVRTARSRRAQRQWQPVPPDSAAVFTAAQFAPPGTLELGLCLLIKGWHSPESLRRVTRRVFARHPELAAEVHASGVSWRWRVPSVGPAAEERVTVIDGPPQSPESAAAQVTGPLREGHAFALRAVPCGTDTVLGLVVHHGVCDGSGLHRVARTLLAEIAAERAGDAETPEADAWFDLPSAPAPEGPGTDTASHPSPWSALLGEPTRERPSSGVLDGRAGGAVVVEVPLAADAAARRGREFGVTATVALVAAVRRSAAAVLGMVLDRVTVPFAESGRRLMTVRPLPLIDPSATTVGTMKEECGHLARLLFDALERGRPPAELVGGLTGSVFLGLPDVMVSIAPRMDLDGDPLVLRELPFPRRGCPAALTVELEERTLRLVGHSALVTHDELRHLAESVVGCLSAGEAEGVTDGPLPPLRSLRSLRKVALERNRHVRTLRPEESSDHAPTDPEVLRAWRAQFGEWVGPDDSLFDLGADSISVSRLAVRLREVTATECSPRQLFGNPTPARFSAWLATRRKAEEPAGSVVEAVLADAWDTVLDCGRINRDQSFLDLGGHSLLAMHVVRDLRRQGWRVGFEALLDGRSLAEVARSCAPVKPAEPMEVAVGAPADEGPASPAQNRAYVEMRIGEEHTALWQAAGRNSNAYQFQAAIRIRGELVPERWRLAAEQVIARHDVLRTTYTFGEQGLRRTVREDTPAVVRVEDLRPTGTGRAEVEQRLREHEEEPWDLSSGPLIRWLVLRVNDHEWVISQVEHHFVHDGISFAILLGELLAAYRGDRLPPTGPASRYGFWCERLERREPTEHAADTAYWETYLSGAPVAPAGPPVRDPAAVSGPRPAGAHRTVVSAQTRSAMRRAFRGSSEFAVLTAAFARAVAAVSGEDDVVIGSALPGRPLGAEECVGMFVTTVCLRFDTTRSDEDLVARAGGDIANALDHQLLPFDEVVQTWREKSGLVRGLPFEAMFSLHNAPLPELTLGTSSEVTLEYRQNGTAKVPLDIVVIERRPGVDDATEDDFELIWEYDLARYEDDDIALLGDVFALELARLIGAEQGPGAGAAGHDAIAAGPAVRHASLEAVLDRVVGRVSVEDAIRWSGGSSSWRTLSRAIATVEPSDGPVVAADTRSGDFVVEVLRRLRSGIPVMPWRQVDEARLVHLPQPDELPDTMAYALLTSGTSGTAKYTAVGRTGLANHFESAIRVFGVGSGDVVLSCSAFGFDAFWEEALVALASGARLVIADLDGGADRLIDRIEQERITIACMTTELFHLLTDELVRMDRPIPPSLRTVVIGGERYDHGRLEAWTTLPGADGTRVLNTYGPTEATIGPLSAEVTRGSRVVVPRGKNIIGTALDNVLLRVVAPNGSVVPAGCVGELWIGGPGVALGYLGRPDLTRERFITMDGVRWYRTGDLVRMGRGGAVEYLGRSDDQLKIRGHRVEPAEVEELLGRCPGVRRAVVVAERTDRENRLLAFVDGTATASAVTRWSRASLPAHLVPHVVKADAFPMTVNGKIDRSRLPAMAHHHAPERATVFEPPAPGPEADLAAVWAEVLGCEAVDRNQSFLDLGGHSLAAMKVITMARSRIGMVLELRNLLSGLTLAEVAVPQ